MFSTQGVEGEDLILHNEITMCFLNLANHFKEKARLTNSFMHLEVICFTCLSVKRLFRNRILRTAATHTLISIKAECFEKNLLSFLSCAG